jgi:8-oxo-dGTP pyrophosphatase MutT (NUDIX family)
LAGLRSAFCCPWIGPAAPRRPSYHTVRRARRFDARFLAANRADIALELPGGGPSGELDELAWLPIEEAKKADVPAITRTMLTELQQRLADDPDLTPGVPAPLYRLHRNRFIRELI